MTKSPDAFRTISEVAEWLDRPAHVLRFWESKFTQVKPIKRAGGRRYYRPEDMMLLGGIKRLLHDDGMTIKGVQKMLREQGVKHVAEMSQPLDAVSEPDALVPSPEKLAALQAEAEPVESAQLLHFHRPDESNTPAEEDLSSASFDQAVEEYVPETLDIATDTAQEAQVAPDPALSDPEETEEVDPVQAEAAAPDETPEPSGESDFEAPSFFNMFDSLDPSTPQQEKTAKPDVQPETQPNPAQPPMPKVVDVAVDARSDKGAGVLTRLCTSAPQLRKAPPAELDQIREKLRALGNRMRSG